MAEQVIITIDAVGRPTIAAMVAVKKQSVDEGCADTPPPAKQACIVPFAHAVCSAAHRLIRIAAK